MWCRRIRPQCRPGWRASCWTKPVDAARGVAGGYQLRAGRALPPLLLDNVGRLALIDVFHRFGDHVVPVSVHQAVIDDLPDDGTDVLGCVEVHPDGTGQYAMRVDVADLHGRPLIHVDRILLHRLNHDAARSRLAHATA